MSSRHFIYLLFAVELILSGFWYTGSAVTAVFLIFAATACGRKVIVRNQWHLYAQSKLMLVYLCWLFIVARFSAVPETSNMTMAILAGLPVMYLVATQTQTFAAIWKYLRLILLMIGVLLALWALWQVTYRIGNGDARGPFQDRNVFAACMNILWFPAAFIFLTVKKSQYHIKLLAAGVTLFLISAGLFATTSRGAMIALLLLVPVFLWFAYRNNDSRLRLVIFVLITISAYAYCALLLNTTVSDRTFDLSQDVSAGARLLLWQSSINMMLAHPFIGSGWGTFVNYYPAYRMPLETASAGFFAHNDYLQLGLEGGIPALVLLLSILFGLLVQLKRCVMRVTDAGVFESAALLLGVVAMFIHAFVNFIFYVAFLNIVAGLYLARAAMLMGKADVRALPECSKINSSLKYLSAAVVITFVSLPYMVALLGQTINDKSNIKIENLVSEEFGVYQLAEFITVIQPQSRIAQETILQTFELALQDSDFIREKGRYFYRELLVKALQRFDRVRALNANEPKLGVREIRILLMHHEAFGDDYAYRKAQQILNENLRANPNHIDSMIMQSRLQLAQGKNDEALHTIENGMPKAIEMRDRLLVRVEMLRQLAAPVIYPELDVIEKELRKLQLGSETGNTLILEENYYADIDSRLDLIARQIEHKTNL